MKPAHAGGDQKTVGIWIRVSTEDQVKGESPEVHEARARAYAASRGWNVATVYRLDAVSGKSVRENPECERMLRDVASGAIHALIFSKLARLARNTRELLDFADYFEKHGADLVSLQESIDTSTPAGRLFYTMIAALAQWEREEIAARIQASVKTRAQLGRPIAGASGFGYRWVDKKLVLDEKEAPVRRLMFDLYLEHRRLKTVARLLTERGYRSRKGARFTDRTVLRLLSDPIAKGLRRSNFTRSGSEGCELKPESEWVWLEAPAIVSAEVWDQVQALITQRKLKRAPGPRPRHLFTGLVFCECGGKMTVPSNSPKYICGKCRNKIPTDDLETVYREQLKAFVLSPKEVARHLAEADEVIRSKQELLDSLDPEERKLTTELDAIMDLYLAKQLPQSAFGERYGKRETRREQIRADRPRILGELDFLKISRASSDEIIWEAQDVYSRWTDLTHDEQRRLIEDTVSRITVGKGEVSIDLRSEPSSAEIVAGKPQTLTAATTSWWSAATEPRRPGMAPTSPSPSAGSAGANFP